MSRSKAKIIRKSSGFLGKIVALLLGFILGVVGTLGGLVGGGYYLLSSVKIKDAVNGVSGATGQPIDYTQYITEEYAEKTVLELIGSLGEVAGEFQNGTGSLSTLEKISPYVRTAIEELSVKTGEFGVPIDVDTLMTTPFGELSAFAQETVNSVELGKVIETATGSISSVLLLLCYGEEGVNYTQEADGTITMIGDNKPLTVGDLVSDEGITGVLNKISLASLIESTGEVNPEDAIMRTLLYGTKGVDYEIVNGEIVMRPIAFSYNSSVDAFADDEGNPFLKDGDVWKNESGDIIRAYSTAPVSTSSPVNYDYTVTDKDGNILYELKFDSEAGVYFAYLSGVRQTHRGLTLGDLLGGQELSTIFEDIYLGDLLDLNEQSDSILIALAYGTVGEDYDFVNGEIVPREGSEPTSLGSLMSGNLDFLDNMTLAALLGNISPLDDPKPNSMLLLLAYGEEGVHYEISGDEIVWKNNPETNEPYKARSIRDLVDDPEGILDTLTLSGLLGVSPLDDPKPNNILLALAYGEEGKHYIIEGGEIVWQTNPETGEQYSPRTIQDITEDPDAVFDGLTLGSLLDISPLDDPKPDTMLLILAYGEEGTHYTIESGEIVWKTNPETGEQYKARSLQDLMSDPDAIFDGLTLGGLLDISPLDDPKPDSMLLVLAYGEEGTHYTIESGEIVWKTNPTTGEQYKARTIRDLMDDPDAIFEEMTLGSLFDISPLDDPKPDSMLLVLAYGEEGTHYTIESGEIVWKTNPTTGEQYKARTVQDLMNDPNAIFEEMTLGSLLDISPLDDPKPDKMILLLAFGEEGKHYEISSGEIVWNTNPATGIKYKARTVQDLIDNPNAIFEEMTLGALLDVSPLDDPKPNNMLLLLAYGEEGTHYDISGNEIVWKTNPATGEKYEARTLQNLMNNSNAIFEEMTLGALLGVSPLDNPKPDNILLMLAYGEEGVHYEISGDEIVWKTDPITGDAYKPRSLQSLMDNPNGIFEDMTLGALLGVSPLDDPKPDPMLLVLAYGEEDVHYEIVDGEIVWLQDYAPRTLQQLMDDPNTLLDDVSLASMLSVTADSDPMMLQLAYGNANRYTIVGDKIVMNAVLYTIVGDKVYDDTQEQVGTVTTPIQEVDGEKIYKLSDNEYIRGTDADGYYAYPTQEKAASGAEVDRIPYKKTTLSTFRGENASSIIEGIELGAALGIDILTATDELMLALAYGYEGTHYEKVIESGKTTVMWKTNPENGLPYKPRTIKDMQNAQTLINDIRLESVLELNADSPAILKTIVYGKKGVDYREENGEIVPVNPPLTIGDLENTEDLLNDIELNALMTGVDTEDTLMMFLLYGEKDVQYTVIGGEVIMMDMTFAVANNTAYDVYGEAVAGTVATVSGGYTLTIDGNVYYLTEPVMIGSQQLTISVGGVIANVYYATDVAGEKITYSPHTLQDFTEGNLIEDMMNKLSIGDIIGGTISKDTSPLLYAIQDWTVNDLKNQDNINQLTLLDVLGEETVNESEYFREIGNTPICDLSTALDSLKITHLFAYDVYKTIKVGENTYFAYTDATGNLQRLYEKTEEDGTIKYYKDSACTVEGARELDGAWHYMMQDPVTGEVQEDMDLSHMDTMISNMTENMHKATLNELEADGIIVFGDGEGGITESEIKTSISIDLGVFGSKTFNIGEEVDPITGEVIPKYYYYPEDTEKTTPKETVGELTVEEMLDYLENMFNTVNRIEEYTHS